ncbi:hypothetical protein GGR28_002037 [Lewinella aquimaris]|uniref:Secreted protein n=1 Tax=Neolewinella aquimaris TaxID=1835722 RepID=A0A840E805_9BACT|nr:DUF6660 family protein [Neolewinella aquimaris]MBB4079417.1 hypothetical protein [Neolewinella aquimaris]
MRVPLLILAFYLLTLAAMPCCDDHAVVEGEPTATEASSDDIRPAHQEDHCTPFCSCVCCGVLLDSPPALFSMATLPLPPLGKTQPNFERTWKENSFTHGEGQPPRA